MKATKNTCPSLKNGDIGQWKLSDLDAYEELARVRDPFYAKRAGLAGAFSPSEKEHSEQP